MYIYIELRCDISIKENGQYLKSICKHCTFVVLIVTYITYHLHNINIIHKYL